MRYNMLNLGDEMDSQYDGTGDFDQEAIPIQSSTTYNNIQKMQMDKHRNS